jgi:hypothetical protein
MVSSQRLWRLVHEAGPSEEIYRPIILSRLLDSAPEETVKQSSEV